MKITLRESTCGYLVVAEDGRDRFVQFESDYIGLASALGFHAACAEDDCAMPPFPRDFLDGCVGRSFDDPGYFD